VRTGRGRGHVGHVHDAGFYASDGEFLQLIVPFVCEGLAAGEPVVIGYDDRKAQLLRAELPRPEAVDFITDARLYATPARAIDAYRQLFELWRGAKQIRIAGDVPHEGIGGQFAGWDRYESAVNLVWQQYPVYSRCLYDARTVADDVVDVVERTHRHVVSADGRVTDSRRFEECADFTPLPPPTDPLEACPAKVTLVDPSLTDVMRQVAAQAQEVLDPLALSDLLFALSEAFCNAEDYGCPPTVVRMWTDADHVVVQVHDAGFGPDDPLVGLVPGPSNSDRAGLGLWLTHLLEDVDIALLTDRGFTVRLRADAVPA
jgi:anti-sigma regulatory factor (Ser/Thr protein kinase)